MQPSIAPRTTPAGRDRRHRPVWWRDERLQYVLMFAPALLLLIGILYPFGLGVLKSFTNERLYLPTVDFVGLRNYVDLFSDPTFRGSLARTIGFVLGVLAVQLPLGVALALLLDATSPFRTFFRNTLVLPLLIPPIVAGLMWKTMMQPASGVLNWFLRSFGLEPLPWLSHPSTALASIVLIETWVFIPFVTLILLAGLQAIPDDVLEAVRVDGASEVQAFWFVKLPWLVPYALLVMLFRIPDALKAFDIIYPATRGGPVDATRLMHVMAYQEAFRWSNIGTAMAILFVLWLIAYVVSMNVMRLWRQRSGAVHGA